MGNTINLNLSTRIVLKDFLDNNLKNRWSLCLGGLPEGPSKIESGGLSDIHV